MIILIMNSESNLLDTETDPKRFQFLEALVIMVLQWTFFHKGFSKVGGMDGLWEKYGTAIGQSITTTTAAPTTVVSNFTTVAASLSTVTLNCKTRILWFWIIMTTRWRSLGGNGGEMYRVVANGHNENLEIKLICFSWRKGLEFILSDIVYLNGNLSVVYLIFLIYFIAFKAL